MYNVCIYMYMCVCVCVNLYAMFGYPGAPFLLTWVLGELLSRLPPPLPFLSKFNFLLLAYGFAYCTTGPLLKVRNFLRRLWVLLVPNFLGQLADNVFGLNVLLITYFFLGLLVHDLLDLTVRNFLIQFGP